MIPVRQWILVLIVGTTAGGVWAQQARTAPAKSLPAEEELTLQTLKRQLGDPKRTAETRLDAARLLLANPSDRAIQVLRQCLVDSSNLGAQQAVAEAIAEYGGGRKEFIAPLMAMLTGDEPQVRPSAARALVTYQNHGVTDRLIAAANNPALDRAVRRVTIEALQRIVEKRCIEALIQLLDDPDSLIRSTAADSLQRMTNIRRFGASRSMWDAWFDKQRDKDDVAWLRERNDGLTRAKMSLERQSTRLRARLIESLESLYNITPKPQRAEILLSFLNDPIAEVRLLGETLTDRMIAANQEIPPEVRQRVRLLLFDDDPRVRESAAVLEANLADPKTMGLLLGRLRAEQIPDVRVGLLKALGRLGSEQAVGALLNEIRLRGEEEAAAAAEALGRIAADKPLSDAQKTRAIHVLVERYRQAAERKNSLTLRESLLSALGALPDPAVEPVLTSALSDPSPLIRLAAIGGLSRLQATGSAGAIAPLVGDEDRGVRQAALAALIALDGKEYLQTILRRTDPKLEPDPVVRKEAADGVLSLSRQADARILDEILAFLAKRPDVTALRIAVLLRKAEVLKGAQSPGVAGTLREAGKLLLADERAGEAVPVLGEAWQLFSADNASSAETRAAWLEYVRALLAADQPAVIRVLAEQANTEDRDKGLELLVQRLETLQKELKYSAVVALAGGAETQLAEHMSESRKSALQDLLATARSRQLEQDRLQVEKLLPNLLSADATTRDEAQATLNTLGARAARPLLEELRKTVKSQAPDSRREVALYELLRQILPDLDPYDPTAERVRRLMKIDAWMKKVK
ncbi:MAG: HEAT repeat domain-containing protein [Phycisphaerae bacterium]|nr:HEAT repeat domain-containing protein [Phycisphaerae bacterium]